SPSPNYFGSIILQRLSACKEATLSFRTESGQIRGYTSVVQLSAWNVAVLVLWIPKNGLDSSQVLQPLETIPESPCTLC
ncbi:hypothetical protein OnM2_026059, partial [Erysiphe neolycopersici]